MPLNDRERTEIDRANESGRPPVVFIHGLWLLADSWDRWRRMFEDQGYSTIAPGWPDEPASIHEARANPEVFAGKSVQAVTHHYLDAVRALDRAPAIIGHSFGGLIAQQLAGIGAATVTVSIDPAPGRGVLPIPPAALKAGFPVLRNPLNLRRSVTLTVDEFRYGWANALDDEEGRRLYDEYHVAASGIPIYQAATGNLNPRTQTRVDYTASNRGPMLIISGQKDHAVPPAMAHAAYKKQSKNSAVTQFVELPDRGHSLIIDHGWEEVGTTALDFVQRHWEDGSGS